MPFVCPVLQFVAQNKQIARETIRGSQDLFVLCYDSFPMNQEKLYSFLK